MVKKLPRHLALFVSGRCNLACRYCYVAVNKLPGGEPGIGRLKTAVDFFLKEAPAGGRKITFMGGEPLMNFRALDRIARHARGAGGPDLVLQLLTNGTLLSASRLAALERSGVQVTVSLDGPAPGNDRLRVFAGRSRTSVFGSAMRRLHALSPTRRRSLGVHMVLTPESVGSLVRSVEFFRRVGFGRIAFFPRLYARWPESALRALRVSLEGLGRYYRAVLEKSRDPFVLQALYSVLERRGWERDCPSLTVGPDGRFYACDKSLAFPGRKSAPHALGDPAAGFDAARAAGLYREAREFMRRRGIRVTGAYCPMGIYFHERLEGRDPARRLEDFRRAAGTFSRGLKRIAGSLKRLPAFKKIYGASKIV